MEAGAKPDFLAINEYLAREALAKVRHEYVGGLLYAMAGASDRHNLLAGNLYIGLRAHLRAGPCSVFMSDMKVRLAVAAEEIFYYPDVLVTCDPRDSESLYKVFPTVLAEVLSESTEQIDRREKHFAYTKIHSLQEYVLVAQSRCEVTLFRRENRWLPEVLTSPGDILELPSLNYKMPLGSLYESVPV